MNFSYFIGDNCVINRASLPLETNRIALLTGNDTFALGLVGGIIARVIPIQDTLQWPQLQALIENYSGKARLDGQDLVVQVEEIYCTKPGPEAGLRIDTLPFDSLRRFEESRWRDSGPPR